MLVTAFPSPATASAFTDSIPGSTFLACHFASCQPLPLPVRPFCSATDSRFAPRSAASTLLARCRFHCRLGLPLARPPLPFGIVTSLQIEAFCRICRKPARLPISPDLRSLPAAVFLLLEVLASDQRSRSATFSEACCSSNLLEPPSLCSRSYSASMRFCEYARPFPQESTALISRRLRAHAVNSL
jgi:hypothetical protein